MQRVKTQDIVLENYARIYEYYSEKKVNARVMRVTQFAMQMAYSTHVDMAEGLEEYVDEAVASNRPVILAANHVRYIDQFVVASALGRSKSLNMLTPNTFALAKVGYFQSQPSRFINETLGAVPVFRKQDMDTSDEDGPNIMQLGRAALGLQRMAVTRMSRGENMFCFPEGTRNKTADWSKVAEIEGGVAKIALKAWHENIDVAIVPIGIAYPSIEQCNWRTPSVYFGAPITQQAIKPNELTALLANNLQIAVDTAHQVTA